MKKLPSKSEILSWVSENPTKSSKRDIARAFGIKGADRIDLKHLLKELEAEGHLQKRRKSYHDPDSLPPVSVLQVLAPDAEGDLFAQPIEWQGPDGAPKILLNLRTADPALGKGDRILARLSKVTGEDHAYEGRLIRRIGTVPNRILGVFRTTENGGRIAPIDRGADKEWQVAANATDGAKDGELVEAEQTGPRSRMGLPTARIVARLGDPGAPKAVSLIAIHQHGIPDVFPDETIAAAEQAKPIKPGNREDLSNLPFVTIDPADARDRDDAVFAHSDDDPDNPGGHVIWVAIADVAAYVTPGSALDSEARNRGNSTYFPDRVVPMLPDRLSGDLCSLHENVARPCLAVRMVLDAKGQKTSHRFVRGMLKSVASLTYEMVQDAHDGKSGAKTAALLVDVVEPLFAAYKALKMARDARQPLDLDLPERRIELREDGVVKSVDFKERLDAHRMIEEFMVLANVAAAEELITRAQPLLFRVHEEPTREKLDALREVAQASGMTLAKGQVLQTRHLNGLLTQAQGTEFVELINLSTLRSMTQAYYNRENFGHFGLALQAYAHFTSPIRRYADLIVHRALIAAHGWGDDGLRGEDLEGLQDTATHISETERRSTAAERDTADRYLAAFLSERIGDEIHGRVSGIARFGAFVKLDGTGADGLIPVRTLGREYFNHNREAQTLVGADTGFTIALGQKVLVRLAKAVPVTGGLVLELLSVEDKQVPQGGSKHRRTSTPRKPVHAKRRAAKAKRKVSRTRK